MKRLVFLVWLSLTLGVLNGALAAEPAYSTPEDFIKSLSPVPQIDQAVEGDLNGDGLLDKAILVGQNQPRLYILLQTQSRQFRLAQASLSGELEDAIESATLNINHGSVYVVVERENIGLSGSYTAQFQFKLYRGEWRMLGLTYSTSEQDYPSADTPPDTPSTYSLKKTDMNLLTGNIIVTYTNTDHAGTSDSKSTHFTASARLCLLSGFEFSYPHCLADWKTTEGQEVGSLVHAPRLKHHHKGGA